VSYRALELFILGLTVAYGPCLLFCSPAILAYIGGTSRGWRSGLRSALTFSLVRLLVQVVLVSLAAMLGVLLTERLQRGQGGLQIAGGIFIIVMGLFLAIGGKDITQKCFCRGEGGAAFLGLVEGLVPCAPFLSVLVYAALRAETVLQGVVFGAAFGGGAFLSPILLFSPLVGEVAGKLTGKRYQQVIGRISGLLLIGFGLLLTLGGVS